MTKRTKAELIRLLAEKKAQISVKERKLKASLKEQERKERIRDLMLLGDLAERAGLRGKDPAFLLGSMLHFISPIQEGSEAFHKLKAEGLILLGNTKSDKN